MRLIALLSGLLISVSSFAQVRTTVQSGPWNVGATWSGGVVPTSANSTSIVVAHNVSVPSGFSVTIDQTTVNQGITLTVDNGGTLTVADDGSGAADLTLFNNGINFGFLTVAGQVTGNNGSTFSGTSTSNVSFQAGSTYRHNYTTTEGALPIAVWNATSTVLISGYTTGFTATAGGNWNQAFGHFTYQCSSQVYSSVVDFAGLLTSVAGNLSILATNGGPSSQGRVILASGQSPTVTIGGDLSIQGASRLYGSTVSGTTTINVGGNFLVSSTNNKGFGLANGGTTNMNVTGSYQLNSPGGRFDLAIAGGSATLSLNGDFTVVTGTFNGSGNIQFNGSGVQTYSAPATFSGAVNYLIGLSSTLDLGTSALGGGGTLNVLGTVRLGSLEAAGAIVNNESQGNIRTPLATRTFASGSTIVYAGGAAQFMGLGQPSTSGVITQINNASGVSLVSPVTLGGNLVLTTGTLTLGSQTLTLNAGISATTGSLGVGSSSNLTINGSGALGNLPIGVGAQSIRNLTINRSAGSVTLVNDLNVTNILTLTTGNLVFSGQTLTLSGTLSRTGGLLSSSSSSTLVISGTGALGSSLSFAGGGNSVNTLTMDKTSGSATVSGTLNITNALNLTAGNLSNGGGVTMANGTTITRSIGVLQTNRVSNGAGDSYNVTYNNSTNVSTGLELPDPANNEDLANLSVTGSASVTLNQNVTINGTAAFSAGTFQVGLGSPSITMEGASWVVGPGSFVPATGTVIFNGATTLSGAGTISFHHLTLNGSASLTMPGGSTNVSGNFSLNATGTFNANSGTIIFNGSAGQSIDGNGADFFNIDVNKTAGLLTLTSNVDLVGRLTVTSATTVNSNGFLTVISTSDAASGNGSIGRIATGGSVSGNVIVQRFMSDEGVINRYVAFPMSNIPVSQLQDDYSVTGTFTGTSFPCAGCTLNGNSIRFYNETAPGDFSLGYSGFPSNSNTETFTPGRGYLAYMWEASPSFPKVVNQDITGVIVQGDFSYSAAILSFTSSPAGINHDGWNLLGNPYPSSIQWEDLTDLPGGWTTTTNIDPTVFVTDNGAGGVFRSYNRVTNVGDLTNGVIAAGQSFWLKANAASPAITITESAKASATGVFFRRKPSVSPHLIVSLSSGSIKDNSFIVFHEGATRGYDLQYDALKFQPMLTEMAGPGFDVALLDDENRRLAMHAVATLNESDVIPLSVRVTEPGEYQLSFASQGDVSYADNLFLIDHFLNTSTQIELGKQYTVLVESPGTEAGRFAIALKDTSSSTDQFERVSLVASPNPVHDNLTVFVNTTEHPDVELLDLLGRSVGRIEMERMESGFRGSVSVREIQQGIYVVRARTLEGTKAIRIVKGN